MALLDPGSRRVQALAAALLSSALMGSGCGGDDLDSNAFFVRTTSHAVSGTSPFVVTGTWMVYFASEAFTGPGGTDLNGDGDMLDDVAVAGRLNQDTQTVLGVAARSASVAADEIYLAVVESEDAVDWNGMNGLNDIVLLHWSEASGVVVFVDTINPNLGSIAQISVATRVYYSADAAPVGDQTAMRYVESTQPTTPVVVENVMGGGALLPVLLGEVNDLVFLLLDEVVDGVDRNADGDATDSAVLALLDGTDPMARVHNVSLALRDSNGPVAARAVTTGDWLVGLLVNEAAQGNTNLNDPALFTDPLVPASCAGTPDMDTADDVLHYLEFADFVSGMAGAVNTGLAGRDRIALVSGYLAVLSDEVDANCDLNEDGDLLDTVTRWVQATTPIMPPVDPAQLRAVATGTGGGSRGLAAHGARFVQVVDEAADSRDIDGKVQDHDLVGWLEPAAGQAAAWTFAHQSSSDPFIGTAIFEDVTGDTIPDPIGGKSEPYAGTAWMAPEAVDARLALVFQEQVPGTNPLVASINNNLNCNVTAKDTDLVDVLPVWADFEGGPILDFDGTGYAVNAFNPGIVLSRAIAFFRVDEAADSIDYNGNGNTTDLVLFRHGTASCSPAFMATSSGVLGPSIETDAAVGAAFITSEAMAGMDLNGDGDMTDLVVQYFNF